jgi:hypothetical protein
VEQVSMADVTKGSEFIFRGRVLETRSTRDGNSPIFTHVTFQVLEVYKGPNVGDRIELEFMGGKVGTLELKIADMRFPAIGETGIYFVESLKRRQVHPLYGWQQGHFLINRDASGVERVRTASGRPVMSVQDDGPSGTNPSEIIPRGLITAQSVQSGTGLTVADFKRRIQQIQSGK